MPISADTRVTLVVTRRPRHHWRRACVLMIESPALIKAAVSTFDIARIILDRTATTDEFLHLLASLPAEIAGDVMLLRDGGDGFLSATGRGGDRVLYALSPPDIAFYIQTNNLLAGGQELALTA
jgi:hypothetical protein